jgi:hypothetical protein
MTREAYVRQLAEKSAKEMIQIAKDAAAGDETAVVIMRQRGWYRNFARIMRRDYGGFGDLVADLLGTFSPGTNVHVNWIFAMDAIRQISEGTWDAQLAQLDAWIKNGGTAILQEGRRTSLQANGKMRFQLREGDARGAGSLARGEAGTRSRRNFSRNLGRISLTRRRPLGRAARSVSVRPRPPPIQVPWMVYGESMKALNSASRKTSWPKPSTFSASSTPRNSAT